MSAYVSKMSFLVGGFVGDIGFLPSKARADRAHVHHTRALAPRRRPNCTRHARARAPRPRTCTAPAHVYHARALLATARPHGHLRPASPRAAVECEPARGFGTSTYSHHAPRFFKSRSDCRRLQRRWDSVTSIARARRHRGTRRRCGGTRLRCGGTRRRHVRGAP